MDLYLVAVVFMGGYVIAIIVAGLVMTVRPGGVAIRLSATRRPPSQTGGPRDEILLGGEAEAFGIPVGRVHAVFVRPETQQVQEVALAGAFGLEGRHVPAGAILSADGHVLRLAERWTEPALDGSAPEAIRLRRDMVVRSTERKHLGKLRLVCLERDSGMVTALVGAGKRSDPSLRLLPIERVKEAGPDGIVTDMKAGEWSKLPAFATDWALRQAVPERLAADPALQPFQRSFSVEVQDQQVRLRGYVADRQLADRAAQLARSVPGVLRVDQGIVCDDELAQAVSQAITQDPDTAAARIQVASRFGQIEITGEAPDRAAVRKIEALASRVPGVQAVHNMTTVAETFPESRTSI